MSSSNPDRAIDSVARVARRLLVFCLPLALAWAGLECGLRRVTDSHSVKRAGLEALAAEVDTVITGSSCAYYGISPTHLSGSAFNLANVSQTLYYDDQLLTRLAPKLPKLKRAIISVNYISLQFLLHDSDESWRQYYYMHGWNIPPAMESDRIDLRMWSRVALYSPPRSLKMAMNGFNANLAPETDARGWFPRPTQLRPSVLSQNSAKFTIDRHHRANHVENVAANVTCLEHLISTLRERKVEVVLVTLPVWKTYADEMRTEDWARAQATFELLAKRYGARYLSFLREPRLEAADFWDTDHLNAQGAVRFTEMLNDAL